MLRANQQLLLQQTNIGLLNLRQIELNYYTTFYSAFAGQSAILCGFVYSSVTQMGYGGGVPYTGAIVEEGTIDRAHYNYILLFFWLTSAVCIMAALHNIFCSTLIVVLGPAKALFGPIGSMSPANESMRDEMQQIVVSYMIMCGSFALSTTASFWVVMGLIPASVCTAITAVACRWWYIYAQRIYNRFYFDDLWNSRLKEDASFLDPAADDDDDDDPMTKLDLGLGEKFQKGGGVQPPPKSKLQAGSIRLNPIFGSSIATHPSNSPSGREPPSSSSSSSSVSQTLLSQILQRKNDPELKSLVLMEGHMHKKAASSLGQWALSIAGDDWKRRYFVLLANGSLWYYKSHHAYQTNPLKRLKDRAIEVAIYQVQVQPKENFGKDADDDHDDDDMSEQSGGSTNTAATSPPPSVMHSWSSRAPTLDIYLVPDEDVCAVYAPMGDVKHRVWHFRVDQRRELEEWQAALSKVSSASLQHHL